MSGKLTTLGTGTRLINQNIGLSNLPLLQDVSGRTLGTADAYTADVENINEGNVTTNFRPNLENYTAIEVISGNLADLDVNGDPLGTFSERVEYREVVKDSIGGDVYEIDGINQLEMILGSELVVNGTFDSDLTDWISSNTNWDNGTAVLIGVMDGKLSQACTPPMVEGNQYLVTFDIVSDGDATGRFINNSTTILEDLPTGSYSEVITSTGTSSDYNIYFRVDNNSTLTVDNVSVKEIIGGIFSEDVLPDPDTVITLDETAILGYPDTIKQEHRDFIFRTIVDDKATRDARRDQWLIDNPVVLNWVDETDTLWVDELNNEWRA